MKTRSVPMRGRTAFAPDWIAKCERRIFKTCHPMQLGFVTDPAERITCLVGRGGGKTTGGLLRLVLKMIRRPRMSCLFLAATRTSAEKLVWNQLKEVLTNLGIAFTPHQVKLECHLSNGSVLTLGGCDDKKDIDKLRGIHFDEVGIDECATVPPELLEDLIDRVLSPRLVGALWMIGTPGHVLRGPFYEATRAGAVDEDGKALHRPYRERHLPANDNWDRWSSHAWTLLDGVAAGVPAMIVGWRKALEQKARKKWSDDNPIWCREYLGRWAADDTTTVYRYRAHDAEGRLWNRWEPELVGAPIGGVQFAQLPKTFADWSYVIGMDLGHSDPFALVVLAYSPSDPTRTIYQVYEFQQTKMYVREIAELLIGKDLRHEAPGGIIGRIGWPDGMVADMAALGDTILDELREVYGITVVMAEKGYKYKLPAIELANGDLVDGRIKVIKDSKLEREMLELQWVTDEHNKVSENKAQANNGSDSFLYARLVIAKLFISNGSSYVEPKSPALTAEPPLPVERDADDEGYLLASGGYDDDW